MTNYAPVFSPQVNVTVTAKAGVATISLSGPPTAVEETPVTFMGTLNGLYGGIGGAVIDILVSEDSGTNWVALASPVTAANGTYSASVTFHNALPQPVLVRAYWAGGYIVD